MSEEEIKSPLCSAALEQRSFAYVSCHKEQKEEIQSWMNLLEQEYSLLYYHHHYHEGADYFTQKENLNHPLCTVLLTVLSPHSMCNHQMLMELLESQVGKEKPLPVIPVVVEDVPLQNDDALRAFVGNIEGNAPLESYEKETMEAMLEKMLHRLKRDRNYAFCDITTLDDWENALNQRIFSISTALCYRIYKEIINSLHPNFVYTKYYQGETLTRLIRDLNIRFRNSATGRATPFRGARHISLKEEAGFYTHCEGVDLSQFHRLTEEECEIEGETLLKIKCSQPKILLNFSVRDIAPCACQYLDSLEEIVLPQGLSTIGDKAFDCCPALLNVYFPPTLKSMDDFIFQNCSSLREMILPYGLSYLGSGVFYTCTSLEKIYLPDTLTEMGSALFSNCLELREIAIPNTIKTICKNTFKGCILLSHITLPDCLEVIENGAFIETNLSQVDLPDTVTSLGEATFQLCDNLRSVRLSSQITDLPERLFENCVNLTTVENASSIKSIAKTSFANTPIEKQLQQ